MLDFPISADRAFQVLGKDKARVAWVIDTAQKAVGFDSFEMFRN
jgi:hypothetical protein